jgi:hypothetical protein
MYRLASSLLTLACFVVSASAAEPQLFPAVQSVSARLLDEQSGQWGTENVFDPAFVPVNKLETSLLVMATLDLGPSCVVHEPSPEEARAIARGERPAPTRPAACERPSGKILADIKYGDGKHERQTVELSRFFSGFDGKLRVPLIFYRRLPCRPIEMSIRTTAQKSSLVHRVDFKCAE